MCYLWETGGEHDVGRTGTEPCVLRQTGPRWCARGHGWRLRSEGNLVVKDTKRERAHLGRRNRMRAAWCILQMVPFWHHVRGGSRRDPSWLAVYLKLREEDMG